MTELDFSALNRLAYRGFETAEEQENKDALLEKGYTITEEEKEPIFLQASEMAQEQPKASEQVKPSTAAQNAPKGKKEAFTDVTGKRNYKKFYRVAHDFHKRHYPPFVDREYWIGRDPDIDKTPAAEQKYWEEVADDLGKTYAEAGKDDDFLEELLKAVLHELNREYKRLRKGAVMAATGDHKSR